MTIGDETTLVYDIKLNDNNDLEVTVYSVAIIHEGKRAYYHYEFISSSITDIINVIDVINDLKAQNIVSINVFGEANFSVKPHDINYSIRSFLLPFRNQMLEKVYVGMVDELGMSVIYTYVTYIDVNTGEIKALRTSKAGVDNEDLRNNLTELGFKEIHNSLLYNYIECINSGPKAISLTRKKDNIN